MSATLLWGIIGILILVIIALLLKLYLLRKSAREIERAFSERLTTDTNTLIGLSSRDKAMMRLAAAINVQLRRLRAQRRRFQQGDLELKNAITNISHDLRTPLTAIFSYLDLLEKEEKSDIVKRYIDIIRNRSELLKQLTEELFQYSVLLTVDEEMKPEPVVLNEALEESIAAFYTVLNKAGIHPCIQIPEKKIRKELDRSALSRILSNLLHNAVKYSSGDLNITLSETGKIIFSNSVSGLNAVQTAQLFDRFYTVESNRKSTGLGLSIARTLVERMGGSIQAECKNGKLYIFVCFNNCSPSTPPGIPSGTKAVQ